RIENALRGFGRCPLEGQDWQRPKGHSYPGRYLSFRSVRPARRTNSAKYLGQDLPSQRAIAGDGALLRFPGDRILRRTAVYGGQQVVAKRVCAGAHARYAAASGAWIKELRPPAA